MFLTHSPLAIVESLAGVYPTWTASQLLAHPKRQKLLNDIEKKCGLQPEHFKAIYPATVDKFAELVQALPLQAGGKMGGLLNYGLERAAIALDCYCEQANSHHDPLLAFAIVTLALFLDVGKVISQQLITICNAQGQAIADWLPYQGSLVELEATHYKIRFIDNRWINLGHLVTPLLAKQLLPPAGFLFLAQDYALFQRWLGVLLREHSETTKQLIELLQLADKRYLELLNQEHLPDLPIVATIPEETALGETFLRWLSKNTQEGSALIMEPPVPLHVLASGELFMEVPQIFERFVAQEAKKMAKPVTWQEVHQQFISLGLLKGNASKNLKWIQNSAANLTQEPVKSQSAENFAHANKMATSSSLFSSAPTKPPLKTYDGYALPAHLLPLSPNLRITLLDLKRMDVTQSIPQTEEVLDKLLKFKKQFAKINPS